MSALPASNGDPDGSTDAPDAGPADAGSPDAGDGCIQLALYDSTTTGLPALRTGTFALRVAPNDSLDATSNGAFTLTAEMLP